MKQTSSGFDMDQFRAPSSSYRGAPFWAWNGRLDRDRLLHQLRVFKAMGLGGAHLHPRTGMATPYMGGEFLDLVQACAEENDRLGQLTWLYDEDRWPSGFAGGLAMEDEAMWCRHLRITRRRLQPGEKLPCPVHHGPPQPQDRREFAAAWRLVFKDGFLAESVLVPEDHDAEPGDTLLFAYVEAEPAWLWFNNRQYADTLNPEAVRSFIRHTHERYAGRFGDRFGSPMPAIFTDEPLFRGNQRPASWDDEKDCFIAWTGTFPDTYRERFGEEVWDTLPAVLFDCTDGSHARARWRFHDHHTDRFVEAFAAQIGAWCESHGIALTGHMMFEASLEDQTRWVGEAMRSLRHFQLPGIDMLCDAVELSTAKQAQSVSRQLGRNGVMSELYGVTNWDFPFAGHKRQGDWQAALGVTLRVPHLTWYQMGGEAKRDYPASFGEHVPWWREYALIEDHFARVAVALKSGKPRCRLAVIHPVESVWTVYGPAASEPQRTDLEQGFQNTLLWLLDGMVDADLVSESVLAGLSTEGQGSGFRVGEMSYDAVVLPPMLTIRRMTLQRLNAFSLAGGRVILLGSPPALVEGEASGEPASAAAGWVRLPCSRRQLLAAVEEVRDVAVLKPNGQPASGLFYQMRECEDGSRILFVCRTRPGESDLTLRVKGRWNVLSLNTEDGSCSSRGATMEGSVTSVPVELHEGGHALMLLRPGIPSEAPGPARRWHERTRLDGPVPVSLDEDNVLVLDRAAWRLDGGDWRDEMEVLRLDNAARSALGMPPRHGEIAQPWAVPPAPDSHRVSLRYSIAVDAGTGPLRLALEDADRAEIRLDGVVLAVRPDGYWVDSAFQCVAVSPLPAGEHVLEITWPFGGGAGLEACYLLGDFGVSVSGRHVRLTAPVRSLAWGDWTRQGLPFYGGNVTYHSEYDAGDIPLALRIPHARAALVGVSAGGRRVGSISRAPWECGLPAGNGRMSLDLCAFGTRVNCFGQLHNCASNYRWWGPGSWRTSGDEWSDEYQLRPAGILVAPQVCVPGTK